MFVFTCKKTLLRNKYKAKVRNGCLYVEKPKASRKFAILMDYFYRYDLQYYRTKDYLVVPKKFFTQYK